MSYGRCVKITSSQTSITACTPAITKRDEELKCNFMNTALVYHASDLRVYFIALQTLLISAHSIPNHE